MLTVRCNVQCEVVADVSTGNFVIQITIKTVLLFFFFSRKCIAKDFRNLVAVLVCVGKKLLISLK